MHFSKNNHETKFHISIYLITTTNLFEVRIEKIKGCKDIFLIKSLQIWTEIDMHGCLCEGKNLKTKMVRKTLDNLDQLIHSIYYFATFI